MVSDGHQHNSKGPQSERHLTHNLAPIGVFDSGLGGLSVLRAIRQALPGEPLIYAADSAHTPYGDRDAAFIQARSHAMVQALVQRGARAVVVACNTASVMAVPSLRQAFSVPIIAIEPAIKPAVAMSATHVIGVLGTSQTMASAAVARLCAQHGQHTKILLQACPGWVGLVERGDLHSSDAHALVRSFVAPLVQAGADVLVLGCTHYPFLAAAIRQAAGPKVQVLEPSAAVARELVRRLGVATTTAPTEMSGGEMSGEVLATHQGTTQFFTTGHTPHVAAMITRLWGAPAAVTSLL